MNTLLRLAAAALLACTGVTLASATDFQITATRTAVPSQGDFAATFPANEVMTGSFSFTDPADTAPPYNVGAGAPPGQDEGAATYWATFREIANFTLNFPTYGTVTATDGQVHTFQPCCGNTTGTERFRIAAGGNINNETFWGGTVAGANVALANGGTSRLVGAWLEVNSNQNPLVDDNVTDAANELINDLAQWNLTTTKQIRLAFKNDAAPSQTIFVDYQLQSVSSCDSTADADQDGVNDCADICPGTVADQQTMRLGRNRWEWNGSDWNTNARGVDKDFTMAETQGCSCEQILDVLVEKTGSPFEGHYKFGCSSSVVEDWIAGLYNVETVEVAASDTDGVDSLTTLKSTENYQLMAYGVADAQSASGPPIPFDAKYSVTTEAGELEANPGDWTDLVTLYEGYGTELLDLHVDGANIDWGTFNPAHVYWFGMPGTDAPVSLWIYDVYYPNNEGVLSVDIFVELW